MYITWWGRASWLATRLKVQPVTLLGCHVANHVKGGMTHQRFLRRSTGDCVACKNYKILSVKFSSYVM